MNLDKIYEQCYAMESERWTIAGSDFITLGEKSENVSGPQILASSYEVNLQTTKRKSMCETIKGWFKSKLRKDHEVLKARHDDLKEKYHALCYTLQEELFIHRKITKAPETKIIGVCIDYWSKTPNEDREQLRKKATEEGFKYIHTKKDGNEVWAKD